MFCLMKPEASQVHGGVAGLIEPEHTDEPMGLSSGPDCRFLDLDLMSVSDLPDPARHAGPPNGKHPYLLPSDLTGFLYAEPGAEFSAIAQLQAEVAAKLGAPTSAGSFTAPNRVSARTASSSAPAAPTLSSLSSPGPSLGGDAGPSGSAGAVQAAPTPRALSENLPRLDVVGLLGTAPAISVVGPVAATALANGAPGSVAGGQGSVSDGGLTASSGTTTSRADAMTDCGGALPGATHPAATTLSSFAHGGATGVTEADLGLGGASSALRLPASVFPDLQHVGSGSVGLGLDGGAGGMTATDTPRSGGGPTPRTTGRPRQKKDYDALIDPSLPPDQIRRMRRMLSNRESARRSRRRRATQVSSLEDELEDVRRQVARLSAELERSNSIAQHALLERSKVMGELEALRSQLSKTDISVGAYALGLGGGHGLPPPLNLGNPGMGGDAGAAAFGLLERSASGMPRHSAPPVGATLAQLGSAGGAGFLPPEWAAKHDGLGNGLWKE